MPSCCVTLAALGISDGFRLSGSCHTLLESISRSSEANRLTKTIAGAFDESTTVLLSPRVAADVLHKVGRRAVVFLELPSVARQPSDAGRYSPASGIHTYRLRSYNLQGSHHTCT